MSTFTASAATTSNITPSNVTSAAIPHGLGPRIWRVACDIAGWIPITLLSWLGIPLLAWLLNTVGLLRSDRVVLAVTACGLGLFGLALLLVTVTALWLRLRRGAPPGDPWELEAAVPFQTGFALGWIAWNPLVRIEVAWEWPCGVRAQFVPSGMRSMEEITPMERGECRQIIRRFIVSDVLGLCRLHFRRRFAQEITIKPAASQSERLPLLPQNISGDALGHPQGSPVGDRIEMRPYAPGDPLKLVLWKIYARTGRMLVRTPERAIAPTEKTLAYLVAGDGDEPTAAIARCALERGALSAACVFGADGSDEPAHTARDAVASVVRSAAFRRHGGAALGRFLARGEGLGIQGCVLFVPPRPGEWIGQVTRQIAGCAGPFRAIVGVDGIAPARKFRLLRRLLLREPIGTASRAQDVRSVCLELGRAGVEVAVVDRGSGKVIDAGTGLQDADS